MDADARTRLIQTTSRLLQTQGYHNTGLNQILAESQSPKGSLYYYFPGGKVDLAIASIALSAELLAQKLGDICRGQREVRAGLAAVLEFFLLELESSGFAKGCPVATITLEQAAHNEAIRAACAAAYDQWQRGLEAYLRYGGIADAALVAEQFLGSIEGALMLARARHSVEPLRRLQQGLSRFLPGATA